MELETREIMTVSYVPELQAFVITDIVEGLIDIYKIKLDEDAFHDKVADICKKEAK